jgi:hypothetical protein
VPLTFSGGQRERATVLLFCNRFITIWSGFWFLTHGGFSLQNRGAGFSLVKIQRCGTEQRPTIIPGTGAGDRSFQPWAAYGLSTSLDMGDAVPVDGYQRRF